MAKTLNDVTESDVIKALQDALRQQDENLEGYYTRRELEGLTGWGTEKVYRVLHELDEKGRLDVRKKKVQNISLAMQSKPAYKIMSNGQPPEGD